MVTFYMIEIFHFLKFKEFISKLRKAFSTGDNGMNPLGILAMPKIFWPKGPEDIYF